MPLKRSLANPAAVRQVPGYIREEEVRLEILEGDEAQEREDRYWRQALARITAAQIRQALKEKGEKIQ